MIGTALFCKKKRLVEKRLTVLMCAPLTLNIQNQFLGPLVSGAKCLQAVFWKDCISEGEQNQI